MRRAYTLALLAMAAGSAAQAQQAADAYYDPRAMEKARHGMHHEMGGMPIYFFQAERLEFQSNDGSAALLSDAQGWIGGDYQRLWIKSETEYTEDDGTEEAEIQALYSRPVSAFFDVQAGVRQDLTPGARRTFGVIGVQGLAPYWFEIDTALFISHQGDVSARFEVEYDLRFTQRLILQPRGEVNLAFQDVENLNIGAGLSTAEIGARLRYEMKREFAPYLGVSWVSAAGRTATFLRRDGRDASSPSVVMGLRLWF